MLLGIGSQNGIARKVYVRNGVRSRAHQVINRSIEPAPYHAFARFQQRLSATKSPSYEQRVRARGHESTVAWLNASWAYY
jgi:hypothetical protein